MDATITLPDRFTETTSYELDDFVKRRYTDGDVTLDVALMLADQDFEAFVADRQDELANMDVAVPAPYTSEVSEKEQDPEHALEFHDDPVRGLGYADPEYRPLVADTDQIPRYRYLVTWRALPDAVAEIEVYVPADEFDEAAALDLADAVGISR